MKRSRINAVSEKRRADAKRYKELHPRFLAAHPRCQCRDPDTGLPCLRQSQQVHHRKGRNKYLLAVATWMAVCQHHHDCIERTHKKWAYSMGYLLNRASNNPVPPLP